MFSGRTSLKSVGIPDHGVGSAAFADKIHAKLCEFEIQKIQVRRERSDLDEIIDDIESGLTATELSRKYQGKCARHEKWANKYRQDFIR